VGVANRPWTAADVEEAIFRSEGLPQGALQYGPAPNPDPAAGFRNYSPTGAAHLNVHVEDGVLFDQAGGGALSQKSRYQNARVAVAVLTEALNTGVAGGQPVNSYWLTWLDNHPGAQLWLAGTGGGPKNGPGITITGDYYGYQMNSSALAKIERISVNLRSHGDALFIYSSYPDKLVAQVAT
jgi:hypothetical protein